MPRTLTVIVLLLVVGACNRGPVGNNASSNSANAAIRNEAAVTTPLPAPAAEAPAGNAAMAGEEVDAYAREDASSEPSSEEERAQGCAGEIGLPAARRLVEQCTDVSPATRSPCNTANSCEMIRDEIKRGCGFLKEDAPDFCEAVG